MMFNATRTSVEDQGRPPVAFLAELVEWGRVAYDDIFAPNPVQGWADIYNKVKPELGPYTRPLHRRAVMLEVMRVLAGFESSWDWTEGVDTSRLGATTPENAEAGAWQVSYDSRHLNIELSVLLSVNNITDGVTFQRVMKFNHRLAMDYVSRMMRYNTLHNGPLYKGDERLKIRKKLRAERNSIYPWLSCDSVNEFMTLLS